MFPLDRGLLWPVSRRTAEWQSDRVAEWRSGGVAQWRNGEATNNDGAEHTISNCFPIVCIQLKSTNFKQMPKEVQLFSPTSYSSFLEGTSKFHAGSPSHPSTVAGVA